MQRQVVKYVYSDHLMKEADKNPAVRGRATLTHELISSYGLLKHLQVLHPKVCNPADLRSFHASDFVEQLKLCKREEAEEKAEDEDEYDDLELSASIAEEYGLGFDCPTWPNILDYACTIAGATMSACDELCKSATIHKPLINEYPAPHRTPKEEGAKVILNWTGGWHHAQRDKAAGYCYINDIVLGILVLRKRFQRILYVDLDVHHGDGVQGAFETTKRVLTLSFHKYECGFYPGTGDVSDCGFAGGKGYAVNFPYKSGISGANYCKYFKRVAALIMERYQPDACILQCGADAVVGDPLGGTNLTPSDLLQCVLFVLKRHLPTLILGGGGYNFSNSSRFWTLITAALCDQQLSEDIPDINAHFLDYGPGYSLNINESKYIKDLNSIAYLEECAKNIEENLNKYNVGPI